MKHSRFAKATSIVMSAVVAAAGYSVCAKQVSTASNKSEKPFDIKAIGYKMLSMLKATPKSEWAMGAVGCIIGIASTAGICHFIAHDTLKDLAAHILTFNDKACGLTRLLVLRIKFCELSDGSKGSAFLVLCDNENFANKYSTPSGESDNVPRFNLNTLVPLNSENSKSFQAWSDHIGSPQAARTHGKLKGSTLETLGDASGLDTKKITCDTARCYFDTIQSLTSPGGQPAKKDAEKEAQPKNTSDPSAGSTHASHDVQKCIELKIPGALTARTVPATEAQKGKRIPVALKNHGVTATGSYQATLLEDYAEGLSEGTEITAVVSVPLSCATAQAKGCYCLTLQTAEGTNVTFANLEPANPCL